MVNHKHPPLQNANGSRSHARVEIYHGKEAALHMPKKWHESVCKQWAASLCALQEEGMVLGKAHVELTMQTSWLVGECPKRSVLWLSEGLSRILAFLDQRNGRPHLHCRQTKYQAITHLPPKGEHMLLSQHLVRICTASGLFPAIFLWYSLTLVVWNLFQKVSAWL